MVCRRVSTADPVAPAADISDDFVRLFQELEPRLRRALMAARGVEVGREATAEAFAWGWEHRRELAEIDAPLSYLYRVGLSRVRRRKVRLPWVSSSWHEPWIEPELRRALRSLSERQRVSVVLVHGYGWTLAEVGSLLGLKPTTVQNHVERGLARLRSHLGGDD